MGLVSKVVDLVTGKNKGGARGVDRDRRDRERELDRERRRDR